MKKSKLHAALRELDAQLFQVHCERLEKQIASMKVDLNACNKKIAADAKTIADLQRKLAEAQPHD